MPHSDPKIEAQLRQMLEDNSALIKEIDELSIDLPSKENKSRVLTIEKLTPNLFPQLRFVYSIAFYHSLLKQPVTHSDSFNDLYSGLDSVKVSNNDLSQVDLDYLEKIHMTALEPGASPNSVLNHHGLANASEQLSPLDIDLKNKLKEEKVLKTFIDESDAALNIDRDKNDEIKNLSDTEQISEINAVESVSFFDPYKETWLTVSLLLLLIWLFIWFNQNSINIYFQQKYHKPSPIEKLDVFPPWRFGYTLFTFFEELPHSFLSTSERDYSGDYDFESNSLGEKQPESSDSIVKSNILKNESTEIDSKSQLSSVAKPQIQESSQAIPYIKKEDFNNLNPDSTTGEAKLPPTTQHILFAHHRINPWLYVDVNQIGLVKLKDIQRLDTSNEVNLGNGTLSYGYILKEGQKVFFVGDSLMQGVAPYVMNSLKKNLDIQSINLSKQSTGLTYTRSFNWVETIEKTLNDNQEIGLIVIMLGANDPWSMRVAKGKPFLKFKTEGWDKLYLSRIKRIYQLAANKNLGVIWIGAPLMKENELSNGVSHLNTLYQKINLRYGGIYLDSNVIFGYEDKKYDVFANWQGNIVKVRANDGVHFTPTGQKMIADYVLSLIAVEKKSLELTELGADLTQSNELGNE